ncbi:hypothetical protein N7530_003159 [Penicillium desertorum]|uniref:Zn(2)-C6 fungal-type domain-containing protein n=1 Tax=Penicillium desertorum TaxID=1303715 RepID=A0A9X0BP81_9EURO|nr:hypothetical protein N7530_003159 [Penicillium desertorum]
MNTSRKTDYRRVVNACSRCRHHKIKCTGESPCSNCIQRNVKCQFARAETKVQITRKRLSELNRRNHELEKENLALQQRLSATTEAAVTPDHSHLASPLHPPSPGIADSPANRLTQFHDEHEEDVSMVNPLSCGPPKYITDTTGTPHYLGHTSTWSLTVRLLHLTHEALYNCPFPSAAHHVDSMTYDLEWNGLRSQAIPDVRGLPSLDHALFLINAAKFHTGQLFHLFDEPRFMAQLYHFYENPAENICTAGLWLPHFLVIIALGKAFIGAKSRGKTPPGAEFFRAAFMMLPDYSFLWKDPSTSAEILCAFTLYLQSIDWRTSAHNMIGQALRILQVHGYHTDLSSRFANEQDLIRFQNIWWTVYVLERQVSVLMGVPLTISDNDITASLPLFADSSLKTATVAIHVKLSKAFSRVVNALYREKENPNSTFVKNTQEVLQRVANVASDLREYFPVPEQEAMNGISRVSGYMNLLYHQCIMLATRPFLFMLVEICANSEDSQIEVPTPIKLLLQICVESAKKTLQVLGALQEQSLLECFLPFDLESAVSAGLVITMASLVSPPMVENHTSLLDTLYCVLDRMIDQGNLIAADQKKEIRQLESLCASLKTSTVLASSSRPPEAQARNAPEAGLTPGPSSDDWDPCMARPGIDGSGAGVAWDGQTNEPFHWTSNLSPTQLLEAADMLDGGDLLDWVDLPSSTFAFGNEGEDRGPLGLSCIRNHTPTQIINV